MLPMMIYGGYFAYRLQYLLFMLPALILMVAAQGLVSSRYKRYRAILNRTSLSGREAAERILAANGIGDVGVVLTSGRLSDHYHPKKRTLYLSNDVYYGTSIAAVGIAAHEAGHAVQDAQGYAPLKIRLALVPACNIGSNLGLPLAILGVIFASDWLIWGGLILFSLAVLFQLITLPVEFDASRRAMAEIRQGALLAPDEADGARKVLSAAAMTYVAALAQSVMTLLYYVMRFGSRNER